MNRLPVLKDELAFLEKHLPEIAARRDLVHLAVEFKTADRNASPTNSGLTGKQGKRVKL